MRADATFPARRILFLLRTYAVFAAVFVLAKPCFMASQRAAQQFAAADVWAVMRHGLSLDLSTALYFILLPYLLAMLQPLLLLLPERHRQRGRRLLRAMLRAYFALAALVVGTALVADASLYGFWGFKLDASALQFIDGTGHALTSVSAGFVALRVVAIIAVAALIDALLTAGMRREKASAKGRPRMLHEAACTLLLLLLLPLVVVGLRGGTSVSTTNVGQVYFSQNQFLNHSAVNPVFSFLASFGKSTNDIPAYRFFPDDELDRQLFSMAKDSASRDSSSTAATVGEVPVSRCITTTETLPNIILIIMEGCSGQFTELGGNAHVTPNLTRLAHEGVYFSRCYANSWRTDRGMLSIMSGYPALPKTSIMKMPSKVGTLPSIARTLRQAGYATAFLYGGDADFTNTRGYLTATGVETIVSEDDFTSEERGSSKWGVCDSITFDRLYGMAVAPGRHFITFLTLSSHEPWTVPMPTRFADEKLNAFHYLDRCLGRFVERLRKSEAWQRTLVVIIPDHGILYKDQDETKEIRSHIPMIWTGGAASGPQRIDCICNQSDLAATLLGQLGLPHNDFTFSRDILSPRYTRPFAFHTFPEGFAVVDRTGFNVYDLNARRQTVGRSAEAIRTGKMALQLTADDLRKR